MNAVFALGNRAIRRAEGSPKSLWGGPFRSASSGDPPGLKARPTCVLGGPFRSAVTANPPGLKARPTSV